jgi:hypothetical protein
MNIDVMHGGHINYTIFITITCTRDAMTLIYINDNIQLYMYTCSLEHRVILVSLDTYTYNRQSITLVPLNILAISNN